MPCCGRGQAWKNSGLNPLPISTVGLQLAASLRAWAMVPFLRRSVCLRATALSWNDIGLVELNEAFAPQVLACLKGWGWSDDDSRHDMLNVNGSGISLGHPIGATGGRILANLTREMHRRDVRFGLETMCIGGGQGIAAVFERA